MSSDPAKIQTIREAGLDPARMPVHVAMIMDGNGRWARRRGFLRPQGHRQGALTVRMATTESVRLGIRYLTLYAFSSENWARPACEVTALMSLLKEFLISEWSTLESNQVRLRAIGRIDRLPGDVRAVLDQMMAASAGFQRMDLTLALSYGGREEIVDACRALVGRPSESIDEVTIQGALYAPDLPDVDVVIRTAGEERMSNFLPWQTVYAEFVAAPMTWPEFSPQDYHAALAEFQSRQRRFGRAE